MGSTGIMYIAVKLFFKSTDFHINLYLCICRDIKLTTQCSSQKKRVVIEINLFWF